MFSNSTCLKALQSRQQIFTWIPERQHCHFFFLFMRTKFLKIYEQPRFRFWKKLTFDFVIILKYWFPKLFKFNFNHNPAEILFNSFLCECDRFSLSRWIIIILGILIMKYEYISLCLVSSEFWLHFPTSQKKKRQIITRICCNGENPSMARHRILQWPVIESFNGPSLNPSMGRHWILPWVVIESFNGSSFNLSMGRH